MKALVMSAMCLLALAAPSLAQRPLNHDFEKPSVSNPNLPWGWYANPTGDFSGWHSWGTPPGSVALDTAHAFTGLRSLRLRGNGAAPIQFQLIVRGSEVPIRGKRTRFGIRILTEQHGSGTAGLKIVTSAQQALQMDSVMISGHSAGWQELHVDMIVDSTAERFTIFLMARGDGPVWVDDLSLEIDNRPYDAIPTGPEASDEELEWLASAAVGVESFDPESRLTSATLDTMLAGAKIIGLGEATHGTSEFQTVKRQVLDYVTRNASATLFAIEETPLKIERLNRYVHGDPGNLRLLMTDFYNIWQTEEMIDLVEWMREYNASGAGKLDFVGIDIVDARQPVDSVLAFLSDVDPEFLPMVREAYRGIHRVFDNEAFQQADSVLKLWQGDAGKVLEHLRANRVRYESVSDSGRVAWAIQNANTVLQTAQLLEPRNIGGSAFRDSCMAANLMWHVARRDTSTRVVVTGHNGHVGRAPWSMGGILDRRLGDAYRIIGTTTYGGAYRADVSQGRPISSQRYVPIPLEPAPLGSVEDMLRRIGGEHMLVDLRRARTDRTGKMLLLARPFRSSGVLAVDWAFLVEPIAERYDVLFYFERTGASRLLECPPGLVCGK